VVATAPPRWACPTLIGIDAEEAANRSGRGRPQLGFRMEQQVQVTFQDIEPSDSVESLIREKVAKLEEFHGRIISCRVAVSQPRARGRNGHLYQVHIDLSIPGGKEIVVSRDPGIDHSHENVLVAIRDAFDAASRQLDEYVDRHNPSSMKRHSMPPRAG
jgi:ribosome-associated translation inhibitor RaiA